MIVEVPLFPSRLWGHTAGVGFDFNNENSKHNEMKKHFFVIKLSSV